LGIADFGFAFSRRISVQHRLVYQVVEKAKATKILSMWTHYE
jgi:Txe/YoeB family toxin of Txe-Axe toxin-antitoxin module